MENGKIARITSNSVMMAGGAEHKREVLICAMDFNVGNSVRIAGLDKGCSVQKTTRQSARICRARMRA
mgnify:CR=1 FL=1